MPSFLTAVPAPILALVAICVYITLRAAFILSDEWGKR
jgi:hypothetical protein